MERHREHPPRSRLASQLTSLLALNSGDIDKVWSTLNSLSKGLMCEHLGISKPSVSRHHELQVLMRIFHCNLTLVLLLVLTVLLLVLTVLLLVQHIMQ